MLKTNSFKTFWIAFLAVVAAVAVASAIFVGVTSSQKLKSMRLSVVDDENYYKVAEENNYRRALYSACDSMKNMDAALGKAAISTNPGNQVQMLTNVIIHANQVNQNLAHLPLSQSENLEACQKFVNQTQDYATYLVKRIAQGQQLSQTQRMSLADLDNVATRFYDFLQQYAQSDSGMFLTNGNGMGDGAFSESLGNVKENTFTYEKLIYDGPFSDSVQQKVLRVKRAPHSVGQSTLQVLGQATFAQEIKHNGLWYCYNLPNGRAVTACDGRLCQYETYSEGASTGQPLNKEQCIATAESFCKSFGYDVKGVWISKVQDSTTYVNCATVIDGVIIYPDLIKVAVDSYSGQVVGFEAKAYLLNHRDWSVQFGQISAEEAQKSVGDLSVTNVAKALVEKDNKHYLCYEFQCEHQGRQYYVYVDSQTGLEVEIFKVIQNTEGHTTM